MGQCGSRLQNILRRAHAVCAPCSIPPKASRLLESRQRPALSRGATSRSNTIILSSPLLTPSLTPPAPPSASPCPCSQAGCSWKPCVTGDGGTGAGAAVRGSYGGMRGIPTGPACCIGIGICHGAWSWPSVARGSGVAGRAGGGRSLGPRGPLDGGTGCFPLKGAAGCALCTQRAARQVPEGCQGGVPVPRTHCVHCVCETLALLPPPWHVETPQGVWGFEAGMAGAHVS